MDKFITYNVVIDWLQWYDFPNELGKPDMPQVALSLIKELKEENADLKKQLEKYKTALEFYTHSVKYHTHHLYGYGFNKSKDQLSEMDIDSGLIAREALKPESEGK